MNKNIDADGVEDETVGQQYLEKHNNWPAPMWIQTSYNTYGNQHKLGGTPLRGNYAGIGFEWDEDNNIFWPKSLPFPMSQSSIKISSRLRRFSRHSTAFPSK